VVSQQNVGTVRNAFKIFSAERIDAALSLSAAFTENFDDFR
jgi:hypothetical protein